MQSSMLKLITEDFGNGGTIDGDIVITGDLQVSGGGSLSFDEIIEGTQVIDVTNTEALLVRKNGDGGDVFIVDTTNSRVGIGVTPTVPLEVHDDEAEIAIFKRTTSAQSRIAIANSTKSAYLGLDGDEKFHIGFTQNLTNNTAFVIDDANNNIGIKNSAPSTCWTSADDLVVGNTSQATTGMTLMSTTSGASNISFADTTGSSNMSYIRYDHNDKRMTFATEHTQHMFLDENGKLGIGTSSPVTMLNLKGDGTSIITLETSDTTQEVNNLTGAIYFRGNDATSGAGGTRAMIKANAQDSSGGHYMSFSTAPSAGTVAERVRIDMDGNVGIGVSPTSKLSVSAGRGANTGLEILDSADSNNKRIDLRLDADGDGYLSLVDASETTKVQLYSNGVSYFNGGNVGIGTASPDTPLTLGESGSPSAMKIFSATNGNPLLIYEDTDNSLLFNFFVSSADDAGLLMYGNGASSKIALLTNGSSYFNGGNVGIGTDSPASKLHIQSANEGLRLANATNGSGQSIGVGFYSHTANTAGSITGKRNGSGLTYDLLFSTTSNIDGDNIAEKMRITGAGNVGIGTTSPASESGGTTLHIAETGGSTSAVLTLTGGSGGNGSFTGQIQFNDKDDTDERIAMIGASQSGTGTPPGGKLHFYTQIDGGALTEALNLDASQNATFAGTITSSVSSGDNFLILKSGSTGSSGIDFYEGDSEKAHITFDTTSNLLTLGRAGGDLSIDNSGNATFAGTITTTSSADEKIMLKGSNSPYIRFYEGTTAKAYLQWHSDGVINLENQERSTKYAMGATHAFTGGDATFAGNIEVLKGSPLVRVKDSTNDVRGFLSVSSGVVKMGGSDNNNVEIQSNGTTRLTISSSGSATFAGDVTTSKANATGNSIILQQSLGSLASPSTSANTNILGKIQFVGKSSNDTPVGAEIKSVITASVGSTKNMPSSLVFSTQPSGGADLATALTIDSSQNATFNGDVSVPATNKLRLDGASGHSYIYEHSNDDVRVYVGGTAVWDFLTTGAGVSATGKLHLDGGGDTYIQESSANVLKVFTGGTQALEINASQNATFAGVVNAPAGINFPDDASSNPSSDVNTLDSYEEGTWTPVYKPSGGSFNTMTMDIVSATYTKIGRQVTVRATFKTDSVNLTGASGTLRIDGLPFTAVATDGESPVLIGHNYSWVSDNHPYSGYVLSNTTNILLVQRDTSNGATGSMVPADLTAGVTADQNGIIMMTTYFV